MGEREKTAAATVTQNKVPESAQRAVASLGRKTTLFGEAKDCEKSLRSLKRLWERARERVREREQRSRAVIGCAASRATASKASAPPSATYSSSSSAVHAGSVVAAQNYMESEVMCVCV